MDIKKFYFKILDHPATGIILQIIIATALFGVGYCVGRIDEINQVKELIRW